MVDEEGGGGGEEGVVVSAEGGAGLSANFSFFSCSDKLEGVEPSLSDAPSPRLTRRTVVPLDLFNASVLPVVVAVVVVNKSSLSTNSANLTSGLHTNL